MLADTRILSRHRSHTVLGECDAVIFSDESTAQLHRVRKDDIDQALLRALEFEGRWIVFDLRSVQRALAADIAQAPDRDARGIVFFTLRAHFTCASEFTAKAVSNAVDSWRDADDAPRLLRHGDMLVELGPITSYRGNGTPAALKAMITRAPA
jgi:hypothetical protein